MSYEIFVSRPDLGALAPQEAVLPFLERLPGWAWEDRKFAHFAWPEYGAHADEVVYGAADDPVSLTFMRPSELTMELAFVLAAMFGGEVSDPEAVLTNEYFTEDASDRLELDEDFMPYPSDGPNRFDGLLWRARVAPLGVAPGSGWAQLSRHFLHESEGISCRPASLQELEATEQRLGLRLPPLLREWYLDIGDLGYLPALDELRVDGDDLVLHSARFDPTSGSVTPDGRDPVPLQEFLRDTALWEF